MPGQLRDDADGKTIARVCSGISVLHEKIKSFRVSHHALLQRVEFLRRELFVDFAPEDFVFARRVTHDGFVFSRAPRMLARVNDQCAVIRKDAFVAACDLFIKLRRVEIPIDVGGFTDAVVVESVARMFASMLLCDFLCPK